MLSALLAAPQLLRDSIRRSSTDGDPVAAEARVASARRRSISMMREAQSRSASAESREAEAEGREDSSALLHEGIPFDKHAPTEQRPSLKQRRASLGLPPEHVASGSGDDAPDHDSYDAAAPLTRHTQGGAAAGALQLPYVLQPTKAKVEEAEVPISLHMPGDSDPSLYNPSPSPSNGLPLLDLPQLLSGVSHPATSKPLLKAARAGFASTQRGEIWPHMLVLPSSVTYVDTAAYYRALEAAFRMPSGTGAGGEIPNSAFVSATAPSEGGPLVRAAAALAEAELHGDDASIEEARSSLRSLLPVSFPAPPLLGRSQSFDFASVSAAVGVGAGGSDTWTDDAGYADGEAVRAQQRILCTLAFVQSSTLSYAPQLAPLVAVLYQSFGGDEARTYAWSLAMSQRSTRDEHFMLVSPLSMELYIRGFVKLVEKHLPQLHAHLTSFGQGANAAHVDVPLVARWFRSWSTDLFVGHLPPEACARMMDLLVCVGVGPTLYKLGLQVLSSFQPYLLSTRMGAGAAGVEEISTKLSKLMSAANISTLMGAEAHGTTGGISWQSDAFLMTKSDLVKLTSPTWADLPLVLEAPIIDATGSASSASSTPYTLASLASSATRSGGGGGGGGGFHMPHFVAPLAQAHECILDTKLLHQLYSGMLQPPESGRDPVCLHSSMREGHNLRGMLARIRMHQTQQQNEGGSRSGSGILLLVQDSQGRVFGLFVSHWPAVAIGEEHATAAQIAGGGFVASFAETGPKLLRFSGPEVVAEQHPEPALTHAAPQLSLTILSPEPPFEQSATASAGPSEPPESSLGTSLPILHVERPGSSRSSSRSVERRGSGSGSSSLRASPAGSPLGLDVTPSVKRRGSLATILDALHLSKSDEESEEDADQGPLAKALRDTVPSMSPFRHAGVRIVDSHMDWSAAGSRTGSSPPSPHAHSGGSGAQQQTSSSSASSSAGSSLSSSPIMSRRESLAASLGRAWNVISSVPTPSSGNSLSGSVAGSPNLSRRGSLAGSGSGGGGIVVAAKGQGPTPNPLSVTVSPRGQRPATRTFHTMPAAMGSPRVPPSLTSPLPPRPGMALSSARGSPLADGPPGPSGSFPSTAASSSSSSSSSSSGSFPAASSAPRGRPRAATMGAPETPRSSLERHFLAEKARQFAWDRQASATAAASPAGPAARRLGAVSIPSLTAHAPLVPSASPSPPPLSSSPEASPDPLHAPSSSVSGSSAPPVGGIPAYTRAASMTSLSTAASSLGSSPDGLKSPPPRHKSKPSYGGFGRPLLHRAVSDGSVGSMGSPNEAVERATASPKHSLDSEAHSTPSATAAAFLAASLSPNPSATAARAARPGFHLSVDDTDSGGTGDGSSSPAPHCDSVRAALHELSLQQQQQAADVLSSPYAPTPVEGPPAGARLLLSDDLMVISEPSLHMVFSVNSTLEEGVLQCPGLGVQGARSSGTGAGNETAPVQMVPMQCAIVEAWGFP